MNKIIVLDFSTSKTYIFNYDENIYEIPEDFFDSEIAEEFGLKESQCSWMIAKELIIYIQ